MAGFDGKVSVVMPAFNESQHIVGNLREVVKTLTDCGFDFEVILVDDGSSDNTYLHAARILTDHPELVRIVRYDKNRGKGNALIAGTKYAQGDYIVFLDADMDLHPRQLPRFFQTMAETGADAIIGSKRHPESHVNYPLIRQIYSFVYYGMVRVLFGLPLRDTQTGLKVFKANVLKDVFPRTLAKRFAFDIELLSIAHHRKYRLGDAPVTLHYQRSYNRVDMRQVWNIFVDTLAIFYRMRILRYYDWPAEKREFFVEFDDAREIFESDAALLDIA